MSVKIKILKSGKITINEKVFFLKEGEGWTSKEILSPWEKECFDNFLTALKKNSIRTISESMHSDLEDDLSVVFRLQKEIEQVQKQREFLDASADFLSEDKISLRKFYKNKEEELEKKLKEFINNLEVEISINPNSKSNKNIL